MFRVNDLALGEETDFFLRRLNSKPRFRWIHALHASITADAPLRDTHSVQPQQQACALQALVQAEHERLGCVQANLY